MSIELKQAAQQALEALEEIALAGMSGTGQESEEGMRAWHARQAWKFIGIAARSLDQLRAAIQQAESEPVAWCIEANVDGEWVVQHPIRCTQLQIQKDASRYQPGTVLRIRQLVFADAHPAPGVPDGYALVPVEPSDKMLDAAFKFESQGSGIQGGDLIDVWKAMLTATQAQKGQP